MIMDTFISTPLCLKYVLIEYLFKYEMALLILIKFEASLYQWPLNRESGTI